MFDPYHKWLGIPKAEQPPTYDRLLGVNADEEDPEVIEEAALRQSAHLRGYQLGPHAVECVRILNEVSQARITLLDAVKRKEYEAHRMQIAKSKANEGATEVKQVRVEASKPPREAFARVWIVSAASVVILVIGVLIVRQFFRPIDAVGQQADATQRKSRGGATDKKSQAKKSETATSIFETELNQKLMKSKPMEQATIPEVRRPPLEPPPGEEQSVPTLPVEPKSTVPTSPEEPKPAGNETLPEQTTGQKLAAQPEEEVQAELVTRIRDLYKADYGKTSLLDKRALASKLRQQASAVKTPTSESFVLLREAKDMAAQSGDVVMAFQAIDDLAERFSVDELGLKAIAAEKASRVIKSKEDSTSLVEKALLAADLALDAASFDQADRLVKIAESALAGAQNAPMRSAVGAAKKRLAFAKQKGELAQAAFDQLKENQGDPVANSAVGRYLCFVRGDWQKGLSFLVRSDDSEIAMHAARDSRGAADAPKQAELGDGWWSLAQQAKYADVKDQLLKRARAWYLQALPTTTGLRKVQIEERSTLSYGKLELQPGLVAELFHGRDMNRRKVRRVDYLVNFDWGAGSPDPMIDPDHFSIRWVGWLKAPKPGKYTLKIVADDGIRLHLDNNVVVQDFRAFGVAKFARSVEVTLSKPFHALQIDFVEGIGDAICKFYWRPSASPKDEIVPADALFHDQHQREILSTSYADFKGLWVLKYSNTIKREYQIDDLGTVKELTDKNQREGSLTKRRKEWWLDFGDNHLERLRIADGKLLVEHWDPAGLYPSRPATCCASGTKKK